MARSTGPTGRRGAAPEVTFKVAGGDAGLTPVSPHARGDPR
jgi:hypothetical protein